jgi:hypothetical protein
MDCFLTGGSVMHYWLRNTIVGMVFATSGVAGLLIGLMA